MTDYYDRMAESGRQQEKLDKIMDNAVNNPISGKEWDRLIKLFNEPLKQAR